eukprot:368344-Rhodomonas_salina.1
MTCHPDQASWECCELTTAGVGAMPEPERHLMAQQQKPRGVGARRLRVPPSVSAMQMGADLADQEGAGQGPP